MTNPNNAVRVSSRNGGRGSVYEANAWAQLYNNGILSGNGVTPDTGMVVQTGGTTACPDVLIATNASGYRIALDVVDTATLTITKPASNKRITAIVAYTDDLAIASTESNITGNPASCGLIAVNGTTSANPVDPTDAQIRTAITSDGGSGSQAAYAIIATILVTSSTASITSGIITRTPAVAGIIDVFYPVGSFYETTDTSFNPNTTWGGTWVEDTAGRVLVAKDSATFSTVGDTGGSESHHHTYGVGVGEYFGILSGTILGYNGVNNSWEVGSAGTNITTRHHNETSYTDESVSTKRVTTNTTNDSSLQPYIVVKRWHRTA